MVSVQGAGEGGTPGCGEREKRLRVRLPVAYVALLRRQNGGPVQERIIRAQGAVDKETQYYLTDGHAMLESLAGVTLTEDSRSVMQTPAVVAEWDLPKKLVLIDGEGPTWIALDYRKNESRPGVVLIVADAGPPVQLAPSFRDFLAALVLFDEVYDEDGVPRQSSKGGEAAR